MDNRATLWWAVGASVAAIFFSAYLRSASSYSVTSSHE
jgi:hypothetical protein